MITEAREKFGGVGGQATFRHQLLLAVEELVNRRLGGAALA
jgi:hypothetical protein